MRKPVDLAIAYRLINHGPVVLVSSSFRGRHDVTPIAWHMPVSDDPPLIALEIWQGHFIYKSVMATGDFVVNIPSSSMAHLVRNLGSVSGSKVDKARKFGLRLETSKKVRSPRVGGSIALLECTVHRDVRLARKYNIVLGDVVYAEAEEAIFGDRWLPEKAGPRTIHHLGGRIFCTPSRRLL